MGTRPAAYIGLDVGTSACKAVLLGGDGVVHHTALATYPTTTHADGEVTQDARHWLRAVEKTLRGCAAAATAFQVEGIGVTAPAHVAVLVDDAGEPLARSLLAFDGRPSGILPELRERYGDRLFSLTYAGLTAAWTLPQLAWLRTVSPELWPRIRWMLTQKDYVRYRLTGLPLVDASDAAGTAMMEQVSRTWIPEVCRDLGLADAVLPPITDSTAPGGWLAPGWARRTGLTAGIPIVVGATDTAAELVSVGALDDGSSLVKIASTGTVVAVSSHPRPSPGLMTYPHALPGRWYSLGATNTAAVAYHWLRATVFAAPPQVPQTAYAEMDALASAVPAGAGGVLFLPFLEGERTPFWDPRLRAAFIGLSSAHRREHLVRAVLEGVAFSLRDCRDAMVSDGHVVERPFLAGGGMASRLWRSILVSALGQPGRLAEPQGPAIGAALLAAAPGARTADEIRRVAPRPTFRTVTPRKAWVTVYDDLHPVYRQAAAGISETTHALVARAATRASRREPATR